MTKMRSIDGCKLKEECCCWTLSAQKERNSWRQSLLPWETTNITEVVTTDSLILDYGSSLCEKLGTAKAHDISQRMRHLAHLPTELRTLPASRLPRCSLEEYLKPERFDHVEAAVKSLCSFEDKSGENRFGTPSLALKLGHSLKKCVYIIWGKAGTEEQGQGNGGGRTRPGEVIWERVGWSGLAPVFKNPFSQEVQ